MILISPEPSTKVELYVFLQTSMEKLVQRLAFLNSTDWRTKPPHLYKNNILTSSHVLLIPKRVHIAFSQPTGNGQVVIRL